MFISYVYNNYTINSNLNFRTNFKYIIPLLFLNDSILFIGTKFLFAKTVLKNLNQAQILTSKTSGVLSNISSIKIMNIFRITSMVFFFYLERHTLLLLEIKKKNLPVLAFLTKNDNSVLIDYPFLINTTFFYTIYFFSLYFNKILLRKNVKNL